MPPATRPQAPGSVVLTDGWGGYNPLPEHGYVRKETVLSASGDPAHASMPGVHRLASLLKRWILGTHQGSVDPEHLQSYLEEFTFRFNRRTSRSRGLVFRRLLEQSVVTGPINRGRRDPRLPLAGLTPTSCGGGAKALPPFEYWHPSGGPPVPGPVALSDPRVSEALEVRPDPPRGHPRRRRAWTFELGS